MQVYRDASIPYFKINAPFFCSPLVFEDLNPQVRINEMVSEYSVDYNPCLKVSSSHVSLPLGALSLFKIFIDFSHQRHTSHRGWQKFSTLCLDYLKMHLQVKKLNLDIFAMSPRFLSSPLRQKEITHCAQKVFFF